MGKHTPGPWIAHCMDTYGGANWENNGGRICPNGNRAGEIAHIYSRPSAEANALLIAAAPDLLAALEGLLDCDTIETRRDAVEAARAAILKATGGAE